ncbi:MAG: hypothetical protein ACD_60C00007G0009 [uncultured bacterium]|nr:MAG: hypothetical protein ACD_60C00007G0009 [uncultured bacterium]
MKYCQNIDISFEVFPAKSPDEFYKIHPVCAALNQFNPDYFSVTFGAGGSFQCKTQQLVRELVNAQLTITPHISCVEMTKQRLSDILAEYKGLNIHHLVVIQGDLPPEGEHKGDFHYAHELVEYIRKISGNYFFISVAAYPEYHPRAVNSLTDLKNFKNKLEAGANNAITQYFFNTDAYFRFLEACEKIGVTAPIIPGIMPIHDYHKLVRFSNACGAEIPLWLRKQLEVYVDDPVSFKKIGIEIVTKLCERLLSEGVNALHFYTLNQIEPTATIIKHLQLPEKNRLSAAVS